jgi:ribosome-binding protein aMBF1 (putative translation factor)
MKFTSINGARKMKSDLDKHIERQLKDKEFRIYFDKAETKRRLAQEIALLRKAQHISQAQLAKEIKTTQQVISRLESPRDKRMPSLDMLDRVARALNRKLIISLQS